MLSAKEAREQMNILNSKPVEKEWRKLEKKLKRNLRCGIMTCNWVLYDENVQKLRGLGFGIHLITTINSVKTTISW